MTTATTDYLQRNDALNQEIYQQGPALFDAVKQTILDKATVPQHRPDPRTHAENQRKLLKTIERICAEGQWNPGISKKEFWDISWGRVVYQGTRAAKASDEIDRMPTQIPLFADFQDYDPRKYQFDKEEWDRFSRHWKRRFLWYKLVRKAHGLLKPKTDDDDVAQLAALYLKSARKERANAAFTENHMDRDESPSKKYVSSKRKNDIEEVFWGTTEEDWLALTNRWRTGSKGFDDWLSFAKAQGELWKDSLDLFASKDSEALAIMTKSGPYESVKFSAHSAKMVKYLAVAAFLKSYQGDRVLEQYTGKDFEYDGEHRTGEQYREDKARFWNIHVGFAKHFGPITSLHLMMDLGFKTVKPDRVLTYLFSQLGWLMTLPSSLSQKQVLGCYTKDAVVREVLYRADVLAASLAAHHPTLYTHRLLDIWFVKFGQEPEDQFGITVKLEGKDGEGLQQLYAAVTERMQAQNEGQPPDIQPFSNQWPTTDIFRAVVGKKTEHEGGKPGRKSGPAPAGKTGHRSLGPVRSREGAEKIFVAHWREDRTRARRYPDRIDNKPKEAILKLIERGLDPAEAFAQILNLPQTS